MRQALWKSWLQTRQRFLTALLALMIAFAGTLASAPWLISAFRKAHPGSQYGFAEYLWRHWYGSTFVLMWALCAILLGSGGLICERGRGSSVFTLSLPIRRRDAALSHIAVAYLELIILAFAPSVLLVLTGQSYPTRDALLFGFATIACGSLFPMLSFGLAHLFEHDLTACSVAITCSAGLWLFGKHPAFEWMNLFDLMGAEDRLASTFFIGNVSGLVIDGLTVIAVSAVMCVALLAVQRLIDA